MKVDWLRTNADEWVLSGQWCSRDRAMGRGGQNLGSSILTFCSLRTATLRIFGLGLLRARLLGSDAPLPSLTSFYIYTRG